MYRQGNTNREGFFEILSFFASHTNYPSAGNHLVCPRIALRYCRIDFSAL